MSTLLSIGSIANRGLASALLSGDPAAVAHELAGATLLLPAAESDGEELTPRTGRFADGRRLLWAFTDLEALRAWDRHPAQTAILAEAGELAGLAREEDDPMLALNPAGPGAFLAELRALSTGPLRVGTGAVPGPLADPESRASLRARASSAHNRGLDALTAGALTEASAELESSVSACGELGDRLHGAHASLALASCRARAGELEPAIAIWERAAEVFAQFGEPDLAAGALLDAARAALAEESAGAATATGAEERSPHARRLLARALELLG